MNRTIVPVIAVLFGCTLRPHENQQPPKVRSESPTSPVEPAEEPPPESKAEDVRARALERYKRATERFADERSTRLAGAQGFVSLCGGLAVNDTHAYWTNNFNGFVYKVPLGGGTVDQLASGQTKLQYIAVDASHIFWSQGTGGMMDGSIMKLPLGGGTTPATLAPGQGAPRGIALDSTSVYWGNTANGVVMKIVKCATLPCP